MELSIFLAKLFGLYFLIIAGLWVIHRPQIDAAVKDFIYSRGLVLFVGAVNIMGGLAIAIGHNVWALNWRGLITLLAYVMIFQGIMRFAYYDKMRESALKIMTNGYWPMIGVLTILGLILTYSGFMAA